MTTAAASDYAAVEDARAPRPVVLGTIGLAGCGAAAGAFSLRLGWDDPRQSDADAVVVGWITLAYVLCGLIAWSRRPESRLGPLMVAAGFAPFASSLSAADAEVPHTVGEVVRVLPVPVFLHVFLAYPSGRLERSSERVLIGTAYVSTVGLGLARMMLGGSGSDHLIELANRPGAADVAHRARSLVVGVVVLIGVGLLLLRLRDAGRSIRRSRALLGSFVLALVLLAVSSAVMVVQGSPAKPLALVTFGAIGLAPVAFLIGLLRVRLARSAVADLFVELRSDPAPDELRDALARVLGDPSLALVYWLPEHGSYADAEGRPVEPERAEGRAVTFIDSAGAPVAALLHDPALEDEPELLAAATAAAGIALENARLHTEVNARVQELEGSRARVIEAGQAERKRLERNLHDGAQQRLVALSLELSLLDKQLAQQPDAKARLEAARREIALSLEELRDLSRGLHPAVLSAHGLPVALESLLAHSSVPVALSVELEGRVAEPAEVAAYFVVSESLANIAKHARATSASVRIARAGDAIAVEIADDGVGGADSRPARGCAAWPTGSSRSAAASASRRRSARGRASAP